MLVGLATAGLLGSFTAPVVAVEAVTTTSIEVSTSATRGMFHDGADQAYERLPDGVLLRGVLTEQDTETPVPDAELILERRFAGETGFTEVDAGTSDEFGMVYLGRVLERTAYYRFVFAGDSTHTASVGSPVRVRVERDLNGRLVVRGTAQRPRPVLQGDVNPGWAGRRVLWQRKRCAEGCSFRTIGSLQAGDRGGWRFRATFPPVGAKWYFRAVVPRGGGFATGSSVRLLTRQPANGPGVTRLFGLR